MKKITVIASLLIGFFGLTGQIHAAPQESGGEVIQKVSKTARKAAVQARVHYQGSPQFASIEGTWVTYATNTSRRSSTSAMLSTSASTFTIPSC
jgi:hypothetical protein